MVWVKLDCPRCRGTSSIDAAKAGQYVICPTCQARVLVPINAPATDAPSAVNPQPQAGNQPAAAGGGQNLRKTVQASSLQTWVAGESPPLAAGTGNGSPVGAPQAVRQGPTAARPSSAPAGPAMANQSAVPLSPPMADVPLLPPRANAPQPTPPPAAPPVYPVQQVQPNPPVQPARAGFGGGPPPIAAGGMIPAVAAGGAPPVPPMSVSLPLPRGMAPTVVAPVAPPGSRKVARFIAAEPTQSTIKLAADGQLPSLQLIEAGKTVTEATKSSSMNPLLVLGAIAASFCMSVMMLTADFDINGGEQKYNEKRQQLETYFKGQRGPLLPYQIHLREAQQAYSRGARKTARNHYRKVLDMLHTEGGDKFHGLTGTPASDKQLEELLSFLVAQDTSYSLLPDEP